jgi:hypothetical protein
MPENVFRQVHAAPLSLLLGGASHMPNSSLALVLLPWYGGFFYVAKINNML